MGIKASYLLNTVESFVDKQFYVNQMLENIIFLFFSLFFFKKSEASFVHIILHRILDKSSNQNKLNGYT
jgi:hypothetical protein